MVIIKDSTFKTEIVQAFYEFNPPVRQKHFLQILAAIEKETGYGARWSGKYHGDFYKGKDEALESIEFAVARTPGYRVANIDLNVSDAIDQTLELLINTIEKAHRQISQK